MSDLVVPPAGHVPVCSCAHGTAPVADAAAAGSVPVVGRFPVAGTARVSGAAPTALTDPSGTPGRFGPTHALILLISVLGLGSALFLAGTPLETVFLLLGGCGAIGAATLAVAGGGRRIMTASFEAAARSSAGK